MENQQLALRETQEIQRVSIAKDPELREMARIIAVKINAILPFPLTADQVEDWVLIIRDLRKWVTAEHLNRVANHFILGHYEWDRSMGIQNIFRGIQQTPRDPAKDEQR